MIYLSHIATGFSRAWRGSLLALGCATTVVTSAGAAGTAVTTWFDAREIGLPRPKWSMAQDRQGVLYFGSDCLLTFDGRHWRKFETEGPYGICALDLDSQGRLWAGTQTDLGWYDQTESTGWKFHSLLATLPASERTIDTITKVAAIGSEVTFISRQAVYHWDGAKFRVDHLPSKTRLYPVRAGDHLYAFTREAGLYELGPKGPELKLPASEFKRGAVLWMEPLAPGSRIVTGAALYVYQHGKLEEPNPQVGDLLAKLSIATATSLPDGRIAIGTAQGKILLLGLDGSTEWLNYDLRGTDNRAINHLFCDREGALWIDFGADVARIELAGPSKLYTKESGVPTADVRTILATADQVYIPTFSGLHALDPATGKTSLLPGTRENYLDARFYQGGLLLTSGRVCLWKDGKETQLYRANRMQNWSRPSLLFPGKFLVYDGRAIGLLDEAGTMRPLVTDLPDILCNVAETPDGRLWLATFSKGLYFTKPTLDHVPSVQPFQPAKGDALAKDCAWVEADAQGNLVILTKHQAWVLRAGRDQLEPVANYPTFWFTAATPINERGEMWVVFSASPTRASTLGRITVTPDRAFWEFHFVPGLAQVGIEFGLAAVPQPDGGTVLWTLGPGGLLRHEVGKQLSNPQPHAPLLRVTASTDQKQPPVVVTGTLPYSTRSVLFEFSSTDFGLAESLRFETFIDGVDSDWVQAEDSSRRELTAARDGHFVFKVRAVTATGAVSPATEFPFAVSPPWWRTAPALIGFVFALLPLGFGLYRLRIHQLQRRNAELEEKVRVRTEELAQASAAKTQFVAAMSHDIRNPLNGIVGLALALEDTSLNDKQRELVATLRECTTYLSTLVDDVLDFASIEAGRVELRAAPFSPTQLLRSVVATLEGEAAAREAHLAISVDPTLPPTLLADAGRIQQILVNYVSNALKYAGGTITLIASAPADSPGEIEFTVADCGPGLTAAEQTALFTKFHRLEGAKNSGVKGTGLGLASCRLLADLMGGSVGVSSEPGKGARFRLSLPLIVAAAPTKAVDMTLPNTSVLLVEDADYNAEAAKAVLAKLGLSCDWAKSGAEAVELFATKRHNVVLLDRNLPDMDGTEVARKIRSLEEDGPRAVILAVTAYCTPADRSLCLQAGMDAFIGKPLTPAKLRKILVAAGRRLLTAATMHVSPEAEQAAALDFSILKYLSDGSDDGLGAQVERFITSLAEGAERLNDALDADNAAELADAAHSVLGQARMVGATALGDVATELETAARARHMAILDERTARVLGEIRSLTAAMRLRRSTSQKA